MLREFRSGDVVRCVRVSVLLGSAATAALLSLSSPAAADCTAITGTTAGNKTAADGSCVNSGVTIDNSTATSKVPVTLTTGTSGNLTDFTNAGTIKSVSGSSKAALGASGNNYANVVNDTTGLIQSDGTGEAVRLGTYVTLDNKGTIRSTGGTDTVRLGANATVTNEGSIIGSGNPASGSNATALRVVSGTVTNNVDGLIETDANATALSSGTQDSNVYAVRIGESGASTLTNYGTIRATGNAASVDGTGNEGEVGGVRLSAPGYSSTLNNYGTIETTGEIVNEGIANNDSIGDMYGVRVDGTNDVVNNYEGATITGGKHGITIDKDASGTTILNEGTITGENGSGVGSDATTGTVTVTNYGTITGAYNEAYTFGDGDGVDIDLVAAVYNYGTIQGTGANGIKPGETTESHSEGLAIGGGTVVNGDASHTDALISGADYGITVDDSNGGDAVASTEITNYGTIRGLDGYAIKLVDTTGTWTNIITNYGTISGTSATTVLMGDGDGTFNDYGGSVAGIVDAEGGEDTLNIDRGGLYTFTGANWANFEITNLHSGVVTLVGDYTSGAEFNVLSGSAFISNGTVSTARFTNDGIVATGTGSTLGRFTVDGDYTQGASGTYYVKIDGEGGSDLLAVTGAAVLDGAVEVSSLSTRFRSDLTYTILEADGGRTGTFSSLIDDIHSPFVTPELTYTSNAVLLGFERNATSYQSVADTPNGYAVAGGLDRGGANATGDLAEILAYINTGTTEEAQQAFDRMSPDNPTAGANQALVNTVGTIGSLVNDRLGAQQVAMRNGGVKLASAGDGDLTSALIGNSLVRPAWSVWARGFGLFGNADSDAGLSNGYDYRGGGIVAGLDRFVGDATVLGLSASYAHADVDHDRVGSNSNVSSYEVGAYAGTAMGAFDLSARLAAAYNDYETSRSIVFGGIDRTASGDFGGTMLMAQGEAGYRLGLGGKGWLKPVAGLDVIHFHTDAYTESGAGGLDLAQGAQSDTLVRSSLGAVIGTSFEAPTANAVVSPSLDIRWGHDISQPDGTATASFAGTPGSSFVYAQKTVDRDALLANLGVTATSPGGLSIGLAGTTDIRSDATGYGLSLKLLYTW